MIQMNRKHRRTLSKLTLAIGLGATALFLLAAPVAGQPTGTTGTTGTTDTGTTGTGTTGTPTTPPTTGTGTTPPL